MNFMEKRPTILMAVLLLLLAGYLWKAEFSAEPVLQASNVPPIEPPLPGDNAISSLKITKKDRDTYVAQVDYFYRGEPAFAYVQIRTVNEQSTSNEKVDLRIPLKAERGQHSVNIEIQRPPFPQYEFTTTKIIASIEQWQKTVTSMQVNYVIEWPDFSTYYRRREQATKSTEVLYKEAVALIDHGSEEELYEAKSKLEQILLRGATYIPAYAELARVAMKSNWSQEGLSQAEQYLLTALKLEPKHANSKVLLGYVYTHQKRYKEAESELTEAARIGTNNLWLWANWGELLLVQKNEQAAQEKYMQAVQTGRTYDTYDRARIDAYRHLFKILGKKRDFIMMNTLYKRRAEEFGSKYACFYADYGHFRLAQFGDYEAGIANSTKAIDDGCDDDEARNTLGVAYYFAWSKGSAEDQTKFISQARAFLPEGPELFYQLARAELTSGVIPVLVKKGFSLGAKDNKKFNALAYSLMRGDAETGRRLAKLGARFDDVVGVEGYPVGLIAVSRQDLECVEMMKQSGVDFTRLKFNGTSAIDYARQIGNKELSALIEHGAKYTL